MSILQIKPKTTPVPQPDAASSPEKNPEVKSASSEPQADSSQNQPLPTGEAPSKQVILKVDGPLSHIYTKALREMFANESASIDVQELPEVKGADPIDIPQGTSVILVDAVPEQQFTVAEHGRVLRAALELDDKQKEPTEVFIAAERNNNLSLEFANSTALEMAYSHKFRVSYSRNTAVRNIVQATLKRLR